MNRKSTIRSQGQWFKGNTHAHTNRSDGNMTPEQLVSLYRDLNYSFLAITDHRCYGHFETLSQEDFFVWPGVELDIGVSSRKALCHHLVGLAMPGQNSFAHDERVLYEDDASAEDLVKLLAERGNFSIYAHPAWSHVQHELLDEIDGLFGMEIYNSTCDVNAGTGYADSYYNRKLWKGQNWFCLASDDTHQGKKDWGGGFISVKTDALTHKDLYEAMTEGSFYASQGPEITDFYVEDKVLHLACSPCRTICLFADSFPGLAVNFDGETATVYEQKLSGREHYIRATCTDAAGRTAWTQPIWLDA